MTRITLARDLRARSTLSERAMWRLLRGRSLGVKFRRQHPIGPYVVDFFCAEIGLVLEIDGAVHRTQGEDDRRREAVLLERGLIVMRFQNSDVLDQPGRVLRLLANVIEPLRARVP